MENTGRSFVFGKDGFPTWMGQIVEARYWEDNLVGEPTPIDDHKGSGYRYKVRLFHYNLPEKDVLSDDDCLWAEVEYPVTAGSGLGAMSETPALRQGSFVRGYFIDGDRKQKPIISAVIGQNLFQTILKDPSLSPYGFVPFSGFDSRGEFVTLDSFPVDPSEKLPLSLVNVPSGDAVESVNIYGNNTGTENEGHRITESVHGTPESLESPTDCRESTNEFVKKLQSALNDIRDLQKELNNVYADVSRISSEIRKKLEDASRAVFQFIKDLVKEIRKYVKRKVNAGLNVAYQFLLPSERTEAKAAAEVSLNTFECLLEKILFGFLDLIGSLVADAADKIITVAQCLAESIAGTIIGYITAVVNAALDRILGTIQSIISAAGGALDLVGDVIQFVEDIIGLFTCSPRMKCPDNKEIDFWEDNENDVLLNFDNIIAKATSVAENFTSIVDPDNFDFATIFSDFPNPFDLDRLDADCNVGALLCNAPSVLFGGSGDLPLANAIVGVTGEILGVDIIYGGSNLTDVSVSFDDNCGNGKGASGRAVIENGELVDVIMDWPGRNYIPAPNGSWGGGGTTWVDPPNTGVKLPDGTYLPQIPPNRTVNIPVGSTVYPSNQTPTIIGEGAEEGSFVTYTTEPPITNSRPVTDIYDVILEIGSIDILNSGFNYCPDDEITIENNAGAILEPIWSGSFTDTTQFTVNNIYNGTVEVRNLPTETVGCNLKLVGINIINRGSGFINQPFAYIRSRSGYNARIKLNLRKKIDTTDEEFQRALNQNKVIQVVDCVGKV